MQRMVNKPFRRALVGPILEGGLRITRYALFRYPHGSGVLSRNLLSPVQNHGAFMCYFCIYSSSKVNGRSRYMTFLTLPWLDYRRVNFCWVQSPTIVTCLHISDRFLDYFQSCLRILSVASCLITTESSILTATRGLDASISSMWTLSTICSGISSQRGTRTSRCSISSL